MRNIITSAALGILALSAVSTVLGADEYKIKLDRPFHPGDAVTVSINVKVKTSQKVEIGGTSQVQKDEFKAVLEGTETIDTVSDAGGEPVKVTIKVAKCTKDGNELIPAGSTITAANIDGKTQFKINGKDAADETVAVLGELVDTAKPGEASADEGRGTDKPQKIGDKWPAKTDVMAREMSDGPIQLTADQVKGECTLTDVSTVGGKKAETVKTTITADVPQKDPNNGANVHDLKISVQVTETLPVDDTSHESTKKAIKSISFKMDSPGPVITITDDSTREEKVTEIKK